MALLTTAEYKAAFPTALPDARLQDLLDAAEEDITAAAGITTSTTVYVDGGHAILVLPRPIGTVSAVKEYAGETSELTLSTNDYRVDGYLMHRLHTGDNPAYCWRGPVTVAHDPADRLAERKRAQMALVRLEETAGAAGVTSERVGDWSATYGQNSRGASYPEQRAAILASLQPVMVR